MFTTSRNLMIAATLVPLVLLAPASASAFGFGGFGHFNMGGNRMGSMSHQSGFNRFSGMNHMGGSNHLAGAPRMGGLNRWSTMSRSKITARDAHVEPRTANAARHTTAAGVTNDARKAPTRDTGRDHAGHGDREHGPVVYVPVIPELNQPVFADDQPHIPHRPPVFADSGSGAPTGDTAHVSGPNADTPNLIERVDTPCPDSILLISTARRSCIGGVVHITGEEFYFCPSKNRFESRSYDYTPKPAIKCDGTNMGPTFVPPQGWTTTDDPNKPKVHACARMSPPKYVKMWVSGAQYWELQTWEIYECFDDNNERVERLYPTPEVEVSSTPSSSPAPVTAESLRK